MIKINMVCLATGKEVMVLDRVASIIDSKKIVRHLNNMNKHTALAMGKAITFYFKVIK
jgi:hypothetical protein